MTVTFFYYYYYYHCVVKDGDVKFGTLNDISAGSNLGIDLLYLIVYLFIKLFYFNFFNCSERTKLADSSICNILYT